MNNSHSPLVDDENFKVAAFAVYTHGKAHCKTLVGKAGLEATDHSAISCVSDGSGKCAARGREEAVVGICAAH
jgi:hypothetical protein